MEHAMMTATDVIEIVQLCQEHAIEVILDGGVRRGTHVLKAMATGATAASGGRLYLYALAAAGEDGVERAVTLLEDEIRRGMQLMGVSRVDQLTPDRLRRR